MAFKSAIVDRMYQVASTAVLHEPTLHPIGFPSLHQVFQGSDQADRGRV